MNDFMETKKKRKKNNYQSTCKRYEREPAVNSFPKPPNKDNIDDSAQKDGDPCYFPEDFFDKEAEE